MTDIEELLRESLWTAPPVTPSISDPVAVVTSGVRRARIRFAAGAACVLGVVAAVAVPLSVLGTSAHGPARPVVPLASATVSPSPNAEGVTVWDSSGAVAVTSGGGFLWELKRTQVVKVDPTTYQPLASWTVAAGAEEIAYGDGVVWVWTRSTHEDTVAMQGSIQAVDLSLPDHVLRYDVAGAALDYVSLLPQPGGFTDALAVVGNSVRQLRIGKASISVVATTTWPQGGSAIPGTGSGIAETGAGAYWVSYGDHLYQLDVQAGTGGDFVLAVAPKDSVQWAGPLVGTGLGRDDVWSYDGARLIDLTPSLLHEGSSVAQGARVPIPDFPVTVVGDGSGGLFVSVVAGQVPASGGDHPGLYHVSDTAAGGGLASLEWSGLDATSPIELASDGRGGVDFADGSGNAEHWTPKA